MRILFFLSMISLSVLYAHADDCLVSKRQKKQPMKELQMRVVGQIKELVIQGSQLAQEINLLIEEAADLDEGIFEDKEQLKAYSAYLDMMLTTIENSKNDVHLSKQKNKMLRKQPTLEGK